MHRVVDLRPRNPDLFVADDIIKAAKEIQTDLATYPDLVQEEMAIQAVQALGNPQELYGGKKVFVHSIGAWIVATGFSDEERLYNGTFFADVSLRASFGKFTYLHHRVAKGLCLRLFDATVIASPTNPDFVGETIPSGTFVPVHSIELVIAA